MGELNTVPEPTWHERGGSFVLTDGKTEWARVYSPPNTHGWLWASEYLQRYDSDQYVTSDGAKRAVRKAFAVECGKLMSLISWWEW